MPKKQILVTGGLGYIGSHTVVELFNAGYEPIIIDNLSNSTLDVLDSIKEIIGTKPEFRKVEMCNAKELSAVFEEFPNLEGVIHFAAVLLVGESVAEPLKYYQNNIISTNNLLQDLANRANKKLVFSSSCTVYGNPDSLPVSESESIKPAQSPYGNTKRIGEEIILDSTKAYGIEAISLRYFNPIGAHGSNKIGEVQHGEPHHLVPYITETAIGKRDRLRVFGGDYDTRDGSCIRDYIHVVDIAKAHVNAIDRLVENKTDSKYEVYNLGSGNGYSVLEMINSFEEATGISIAYEVVDRRPGDVEAVYADRTLAKDKLGWEPKLDMKDMLKSAWDWENVQRKKEH